MWQKLIHVHVILLDAICALHPVGPGRALLGCIFFRARGQKENATNF